MTQSRTLMWFERDPRTTVACLALDRLLAVAGGAVTGTDDVPAPTGVFGRAATGTSVLPFGRAGADDYEVRVTLRVNGAHFEDVVAHSFANPHCVDIQVQCPTVAQRPVEAGCGTDPDGQVAGRARVSARARSHAWADVLAPAPRVNEWDEA